MRVAQNLGVALVSVKPQAIADDGELLMRSLFVGREETADDWLHAQRGECASRLAHGVDFLRFFSTGEFIVRANVAAQRRKGPARACVGSNLTRCDGNAPATSQVISQEN